MSYFGGQQAFKLYKMKMCSCYIFSSKTINSTCILSVHVFPKNRTHVLGVASAFFYESRYRNTFFCVLTDPSE